MLGPPTRRNRLAGIALMVATMLWFTALDTSLKWLGQYLPTSQVVWARYASSFLLVLPFINPWTVPGLLKSQRPFLQGVRAALVLLSTVLNVIALHYLQLAQTTSILFLTPLLTTALAGPLLGERVDLRRLLALGVGLAGVLIVTQPGFSGFHWAMLLSLAGAMAYALYNIAARVLSRHDAPLTTFFYLGLVGTIGAAPPVPFFWEWPQAWSVWLVLSATGLFAAIGHWCLIHAHRLAPASVVAPFLYTQIVWMTLSGWLVFSDFPDRMTLIGAAVVTASGLYLFWREHCERGEAFHG